MKSKELLIRYGEISLKGRNRNRFIRRLKSNMKIVLKDLPAIQIQSERDRMFLRTEDAYVMTEVIERLPKVFGIQSFSPIIRCETDLEAIKEAALTVIGSQETGGKTFKVEIRRTDKSFPYITGEIQQLLGAHVLRQHPELTVQVRKPDILLFVDIRKTGTFLRSEVYPGAQGMPIGSNGKTLLMLSGGIDSPVAAYQMLKRGVSLEAIHFESPPFTSELAKQKVYDIVEQLSSYGTTIKLHTIPFTEIQQVITENVPSASTMTVTRRLMMKIADKVRDEVGAMGIVTGESLGQVASQTLESLTAINAVTNTPVLRPLIAMDKEDIITIAKEIATYDISIRPHEDCCTIFTPENPQTKPKLSKIEFYEGKTDFQEMIERAVANREIIHFPQAEKEEEFNQFL